MVVVRLDRVTFSVLEVKVKLEPGSVVFMLSQPWMEKNNISEGLCQHVFVCLCLGACVLCICSQPLPKCHSSSLPH